jgi:hypothetical protein
MDPLTIVVDNDKCVEDMCENNTEKLVSDEMYAGMDDLLLVDTDYLQDDVDQRLSTSDQPHNKADQQVNVDDNEKETEFHVNLNANPLTLETKITVGHPCPLSCLVSDLIVKYSFCFEAKKVIYKRISCRWISNAHCKNKYLT